ncbi:MAG TPA: hypothetical protein VIJ35_10250, partial [Bradyrhizobium sp.]
KYGIRHWSPHDVRRTMTTFLTDHRLGGAAAAILGHKMPHEDVSERGNAGAGDRASLQPVAEDRSEGGRNEALD